MKRTLEEWYLLLFSRLSPYAQKKYGIPADEAEALIHDVFLRCLETRNGPGLKFPEAWFYAAIRNACADYWRKEGRIADEEPPERTAEPPDYITRIAVSEIMAALTPPEQEVLWMQYIEGYRVQEIARLTGRSLRSTEKLLRQARLHAAEIVEGDGDDDDTHRSPVGRGVRGADTYPDCCRLHRMIRPHVRPLRGTSLPRTPPRPALLSAHGRTARQVPDELPGASRLLQIAAGAA